MARSVRRRQRVPVGNKVRQLRKDRGLTQSELAQRIGVQQSDLCRMENGEYKVSLDTLFKILAVFGMDIGEFFREEFPRAAPSDLDMQLLRYFNQLDERGKLEVLDYIRYKSSRRSESC